LGYVFTRGEHVAAVEAKEGEGAEGAEERGEGREGGVDCGYAGGEGFVVEGGGGCLEE